MPATNPTEETIIAPPRPALTGSPAAAARLATSCPVIPVITIDDAAHAEALADALLAGGVGCAEITLRTPAGLAAIGRLAGRRDILVGAGTVLTADQVDRAADAGASFVVSPGLDLEVLARAAARGLAVIPGVATASELQTALRHGISRVKLFPAGALGGLGLIDALAGPFPEVRFMPSGGVSIDNLGAYLAHPAVFAAGCSWIAPRQLIAAGDFPRIRALALAATARTVT